MKPMFRLLALLAIPSVALCSAAAQADTLKVLTAGAFKQVVVAMAPAFETRTGHKLEIQNDTAGALLRRVGAGETFDVLMLTPAALQTLASTGRVLPDSIAPLAKVGIGVAVKAGAPKPRIGTVADLKQTLLDARKVAYIDPAAGGSSGIYLDGLFERMGIAEAIRAKAVLVPGGLVAERLVSGEADLAVHQISEILPVKGVEMVGPLPAEVQNETTYAGAIATDTAHVEAARSLLAAMTGPDAAATLAGRGMSPVK